MFELNQKFSNMIRFLVLIIYISLSVHLNGQNVSFFQHKFTNQSELNYSDIFEKIGVTCAELSMDLVSSRNVGKTKIERFQIMYEQMSIEHFEIIKINRSSGSYEVYGFQPNGFEDYESVQVTNNPFEIDMPLKISILEYIRSNQEAHAPSLTEIDVNDLELNYSNNLLLSQKDSNGKTILSEYSIYEINVASISTSYEVYVNENKDIEIKNLFYDHFNHKPKSSDERNYRNDEFLKCTKTSFINANAETLFDGTQQIQSSLDFYNNFILTNEIFSTQFTFKTLDSQNSGSLPLSITYQDNDNYWELDASEFYSKQAGVSAHWALEVVLRHLNNNHGIVGFGDPDIDILYQLCNIHPYAQANFNIYNDQPFLRYGSGNQTTLASPALYNPFASLDIVTHEYGHGLLYYSEAATSQSTPSRAINEALCDILGTCISNTMYIDFNKIWTYAEDVLTPSSISYPTGPSRSLSNPNTHSAPRNYFGNFWSTDNDVIASYINMSFINHWFYLLVNGGMGTTDNSCSYDLNGIPIQDAEKIIITAITTYMTGQQNYASFVVATTNAASDLFGSTSTELQELELAWEAVGFCIDNPNCNYECNNSCQVCSSKMISQNIDYEKDSKYEFNIFPNPASSSVKVELEQGTSGRVEIVDVYGSVVESFDCPNSIEINIDDFESGVYFFKVFSTDDGEKFIGTKKIIFTK